MNKKYFYQNYLQIMKWVIFCIYEAFGIFLLITKIDLFFTTKTSGVGAIFIIMGIYVFILYESLKKFSIELTEENVIYSNNNEISVISYKQIASVDISTRILGAGWLIIRLYNQKPIRIASSMKDISEFVCVLKERLDTLLMKHSVFFCLLQKLIFSSLQKLLV